MSGPFWESDAPPIEDPAALYFAGSGRRTPPEPAAPEAEDDKHARLAAAEQVASQSPADAAPGNLTVPCPLREAHTIEVRVIGSDDAPLENVTLVLEKSESEVLIAKTDADGLACFRGLAMGKYQLHPRELDHEAWELKSSEKLPPERDRCDTNATWQAPSGPATREAITHVVQAGECISTLAYRHGHLPETLWNTEENAALKELRGDKNILNPGDSVVIPAPRRGTEGVDAGNAYLLRGKGFTETLRVRFLDAEGKPRVNLTYVVSLESDVGTEERAGATNSEGFLVEPASAAVHTLKVTFGSGAERETYAFQVARLAPLDTLAGAQARLCHLGYGCGEEDGVLGPWTRRALRDFQRDHDLPVTCELDDATRTRLRAEYLA